MLEYDKTLILFGRSSFINEIRNDIPELIKKYHTMGCNYFCESFPDVEYVVFYDDITPKVKPESTIITNVRHYYDTTKNCYNLCHTHKNIEFYTINKNSNDFSFRDSQLNFCIHTPSMALNWAYIQCLFHTAKVVLWLLSNGWINCLQMVRWLLNMLICKVAQL